MTWYLLDTNHISAYLDENPVLKPRIDARLKARERIGVTLRCFANTERASRKALV